MIADDEARAIVLNLPRRREAALCHYLPVHSRAASNITNAPGMTRAKVNPKTSVGDFFLFFWLTGLFSVFVLFVSSGANPVS